jgi:hypothetical protein
VAFPAKFTDEQRATIVAAVLDDNHSVREAVDAAAAGEFGPAFTIALSTAHSMVAAERKRRRSIFDIADDQARQLLRLGDRELARLEALPALEPNDARTLAGVAKMNRQVRLIADDVRDARRAAGPLEYDDPPAWSLASRIASEAEA